LFWCHLAKTLGTPIYELRQTIPLSEIRLWNAYFKSETDRHEKIEWYLAQIAMVVDQAMSSKKGKRRQLKDYLIKFRKPGPVVQDNTMAQKWAMTWIKNLAGVPKLAKKPKRGRK
jgi:hypothetical protein